MVWTKAEHFDLSEAKETNRVAVDRSLSVKERTS